MPPGIKQARFEREVMPHLDAAYNLALWLLRNPHDAQDATQEATLRAFRFLDTFRGGNAKAWLLAIVRNTCHTHVRKRWPGQIEALDPFESAGESAEAYAMGRKPAASPEAALIEKHQKELINTCLADLPSEFREVLVLRDLEGLMYKEIGEIVGVPLGTVMSRLSRGRALLHKAVAGRMQGEA